ncbi:MAG TPA: glycoside hydrolase family 57 protein [Candidatus Paceibacterota bacterium]|nr:glycoside hydrolase family 57 protein [Candidatus Paceibacterota bacterium]
MTSVCIYLQVHQPYRVKRYRLFDIGNDHEYFNDASESNLNNRRIARKVAEKSYLPAARTLAGLLARHPEFKFALSLSGIVLEQLEHDAPETLALFQELVATGRVEILAETYYHSLAFFYSRPEFERQVAKHQGAVGRLFGVVPAVFRNTELSYRNDLGVWADEHGYRAVLTEGWDPILGWRSPNYVYRPKGATNARLLLKNYRLSDDVAFRFSSQSWAGWPLTAEKFGQWLSATPGDTVNLFMDYETFGEHQWESTGIFAFLDRMPHELLKAPHIDFKTPSEVVAAYAPKDEIDIPNIVTWADTDRDLTAWVGNELQRSAIGTVYGLEEAVLATDDDALIEDWRRLQTSDHFYYMCTKWFNDGDVHAYFSPYTSPYDAYTAYMNALKDMQVRLRTAVT